MKSKFTELDDKKFYLEMPDPDFSPTRNKAIIQNSIKKYEAMVKAKGAEHRDDYMERSDAVVAYLRLADRKPQYDLVKYFGKKYLTFLRGDDIRRELYANMKIYNNAGKLITIN